MHQQGRALHSFCGHALAAHEHASIDQHAEHAHGPGLVQAAFVATDGHAVGRIHKNGSTLLALVMQAVCGNTGLLVVAHGLILDRVLNKSHVCFLRCSATVPSDP